MLYHTIFPGVIRDDGEQPVRGEPVAQLRQRALERAELVIDRNANRLEKARELAGTHPRAERAANRPNEIIAGGQQAILAAARDLAREAPRAGLVSIRAKNVSQGGFIQRVQQLPSGGMRATVHPHVE